MQTNLLCWQIKSGEPGAASKADKVAEPGKRIAEPHRESSFPVTLRRLSGDSESQQTAESQVVDDAPCGRLVENRQSPQRAEIGLQQLEQTVGIATAQSKELQQSGDQPVDAALAILNTALDSAGDGSIAFTKESGLVPGDNGLPFADLQANLPHADMADSAHVHHPPAVSAAADLQPAVSAAGANRSAAGDGMVTHMWISGDGSAAHPKAAAAGSVDMPPRDAVRWTPPDASTEVAGKSSEKDLPAADMPVKARTGLPSAPSSLSSASPAVSAPASGNRSLADTGSAPAEGDPKHPHQDAAKSGKAADPSMRFADAMTFDSPEPVAEKTAPDAAPKQAAALGNVGRLSQLPGESQAAASELGNADKPNPTELIDQIVKKAVIRLKNGYSEARIDLKPELLGHLRMQISTENQQVTLRILTEHPMVKEIIESSAAQLKAELSSQGLQMEELEVGVDEDPDRFDRRPDDSGQSQQEASKGKDGAEETAEKADPTAANLTAADAGGIDMFA